MVRKRKVGCVELLDHFLARIERHDGRINAVVVRDFEAARRRAKALDRMKEPVGPLHGVPMTVKESFDVAGLPTTWGVPAKRNDIATTDAVAVQRLRAAGAVVMGKTNVPLMLGDWQSYNAIYGTTSNPWDLSRGPGGSSGGGAAALAAGLTGLELGSDIGGSVRQPAHACGVFGHKPSWNLLPGYGHAPVLGGMSVVDIACIGPLGRSAADLALALDLLSPADVRDSVATLKLPAPPKGPKGLRVAIWAEDPATKTSAEVSDGVRAAGQALKKAGAKVSVVARPAIDVQAAWENYCKLLGAVLFGRLPPQEHADLVKVAANFAPDDRSRAALMLHGLEMRHGAWMTLDDQRHALRRAWHAFFADWDVLICPIHPLPAQPHQQGVPYAQMRATVDGADVPWGDMLFWPGVIGGVLLPATTAPVGFTREGLPIGCQIVGPMHADRTTIAVAGMLEEVMGGFRAPKGWG